MQSVFMFLGSLSAMVAVGLGAFGAHALKDVLSPEMLAVYHTATDYQFWHSLGLIGIGITQLQSHPSRLLDWAGRLMFVGILLFSGSLYCLAVFDQKWLGVITPFGGVCFLAAWVLFAAYAAGKKHRGRYNL
jgi:uncharacterized membrane protein YgdD (TMEM256/DUF423 family)